MAGNRTLKLSLLADDKRFGQGLGKAEGRLGKFGGALKTAGKVVAGVGAAAVGLGVAAFAAAKKVADGADKIAKGASKLGVSTDAYQELDYWASQNGVSHESMERAVGRLNQRLGDAASGTGKYAEAFEALGVSVHDTNGEVRDTESVMRDTIAALRAVESPAERSAAAAEVFGTKLARDLMPALEDGSLSLEDAAAKAHELGIVLDEDAVRAGERFTDSLDNVQRALGGMASKALAPLMELFADVVLPMIERHVIPAVQRFGEVAGPWVRTKLRVLSAFVSGTVVPVVRQLVDRFRADVLPTLQRFGAFVSGTVVPTVQRLAAMFAANALPAIRSVSSFLTGTLVPGIRSLVVPIIDGLRSAFGSITDALGSTGGKGTAGALSGLWSILKTVVGFVATYVAPVVGTVLGGAFRLVGEAIGALIRIVDRLLGALGKVIDAAGRAKDTVSGFVGGARDAVSGIGQRLTSWIPGRAVGGAVSGRRPYVVGERGPELFVPSGGGGTITPAHRTGSGGVTINVTGTMLDPEGVARAVDRALRDSARRVGAVA